MKPSVDADPKDVDDNVEVNDHMDLDASMDHNIRWTHGQDGVVLDRQRLLDDGLRHELHATLEESFAIKWRYTCNIAPNRETEDEHHAIFDCPAYADAREQYRYLFQSHITTVGDFLNQPQCNRLAKFLTWIRMLRMNRA